METCGLIIYKKNILYYITMDLYHKRSKVICDIFLKTYNDFIVIFTKWNDTYELILQNGLKIMIYGKTKWTDIVEIMRQNSKRKYDEI